MPVDNTQFVLVGEGKTKQNVCYKFSYNFNTDLLAIRVGMCELKLPRTIWIDILDQIENEIEKYDRALKK